MASPAYGEVWFADLDPTVGHEQAGERPVLVLSINSFNQSPAGLVVILPITTRLRGIPWHVPVSPPEGGLTRPSAILCEALRSVSQQRLQRRMGAIGSATLQAVQDRLRILLNL
jgi:mRNA interferase MazF